MFVRLCGAALALTLFVSPSYADKLSLRVTKAQVEFDSRTSEPVLSVSLNAESKQALTQFTRANVGRQMRVSVNGKVLTSPVIQEPITGSIIQISGGFEIQEATNLANSLSAGNATVDIEQAE